ncbi:MAG: hypothetical protein U0946_05585 [Patescibacteria group bacterium]|nr:hypothetical protein [Patescibacteria group bacterium]
MRSTPSASPEPKAEAADPTADWKTYIDTKLGFSFKYDQNFYEPIESDEEKVAEKSNTGESSIVKVFTNLMGYQPPKFLGAIELKYKLEQKFVNDFTVWVFNNPDNLKPIAWYQKYKYYPHNFSHSINTIELEESPKNPLNISNKQAYYGQPYGMIPTQLIYIQDQLKMFLISTTQPDPKLDPILSTFKFLEPNSPAPKSNIKTLNYQLPSGWQIVSDQNNIFSVGFDPTNYHTSPSSLRIDLNSKQCCSSLFLRVLPYDGGSRHSFINSNSGAVTTSSTTEQEYLIDGKSGLVLYDVDASGNNTAGMIVLNQTQALLIESQTSSKTFIEQVLSTFKFTN